MHQPRQPAMAFQRSGEAPGVEGRNTTKLGMRRCIGPPRGALSRELARRVCTSKVCSLPAPTHRNTKPVATRRSTSVCLPEVNRTSLAEHGGTLAVRAECRPKRPAKAGSEEAASPHCRAWHEARPRPAQWGAQATAGLVLGRGTSDRVASPARGRSPFAVVAALPREGSAEFLLFVGQSQQTLSTRRQTAQLQRLSPSELSAAQPTAGARRPCCACAARARLGSWRREPRAEALRTLRIPTPGLLPARLRGALGAPDWGDCPQCTSARGKSCNWRARAKGRRRLPAACCSRPPRELAKERRCCAKWACRCPLLPHPRLGPPRGVQLRRHPRSSRRPRW